MQKKIARKIASITAVSLASGLITVPAGANADLTPNLQIMQKTEIISDEALDQSYQYDYQSDGNDQKFTQVETSWDNAFVAKKLVVGDWKNYDGDVVVSILKDDGMEYQLQTTENAQVELSDYGEISSIKLQPAGEIANSDASMSGMVIDGDIDMSQASDSLTERERAVLEMRYGLNGEKPQTLEEIGSKMNVTRERIRQIEAKALMKMRSPRRKALLRDYL